jgi:methionyl-tRNA formyltransferase
VSVLVDNESWVLPYAERLVAAARADGHMACLVRHAMDLPEGDVAFFLGCLHLVPTSVRARHNVNLVVHESDLPKGRGFAPVTWQVLEGRDTIPVCLLEAVEEPDAGGIVLRDEIRLAGTELCDELRRLQGETTVDLCLRYLRAERSPEPVRQAGVATWYRRRRPADSELDPEQTLAEQFNLLRVVDNQAYPAFFRYRGRCYRLRIEPCEDPDDG